MPDDLYFLAHSEGIIYRYVDLPAPFLGLYDARSEEPPLILLHENIKDNRRLLRCIFAEELGHHFTSSGNLLAFARSDKACVALKQERLALWWAVRRLVPISALTKAIESGLVLTNELAEHFDITERFMGTSLNLYFDKRRTLLEKYLKRLDE